MPSRRWVVAAAGPSYLSSDALKFTSPDAQHVGAEEGLSKWKSIFRMLCKRSLLQQEIAMDMAGEPLIRSSFSGDQIYAPVPGWAGVENRSRSIFLAFLHHRETGDYSTFAEWCRVWKFERWLETEEGRKPKLVRRNRNREASRCAIAFTFPFEMLDIFIGAFATTFFCYDCEEDLVLANPRSSPSGLGISALC